MATSTTSSREFNQAAGGAKEAADTGRASLPTADVPRTSCSEPSLLEALAQKEEGDFDFDPPRMGDDISRPVDLD